MTIFYSNYTVPLLCKGHAVAFRSNNLSINHNKIISFGIPGTDKNSLTKDQTAEWNFKTNIKMSSDMKHFPIFPANQRTYVNSHPFTSLRLKPDNVPSYFVKTRKNKTANSERYSRCTRSQECIATINCLWGEETKRN